MGNNRVTKYGEWAVVTGASDGIGREIALLLAQDGVHLVLVARREGILQAMAGEMREINGIQTHVIAADLATDAGVQAVINGTQGLDVGILVAAAGYGTSGRFLDSTPEREANMLAVNATAVMHLAHHFGTRFAERGRGGIVLFSSLVAFQGVPKAAHYAATKAYIQTFAEGLERELAPLGVDVLISAPGPVASGFAARADMQMSMSLTPDVVARDTMKALGRKAYVRPGFLSKMLIGGLSTLPRPIRVRVMQNIMGEMTEHQTAQPVVQEAH